MRIITTLVLALISSVSFAQISVKANATNLAVGLFGVTGEMSIGGQKAVQLGVGYMPNRNIIAKQFLSEQEKNWISEQEEGVFQGMDFTGFNITPEFKLYTGEDGCKGFYFDFWAKYSKYSLLNTGYQQEFEPYFGPNLVDEFKFDGSISNISAGIGLGTQWFIKDLIAIDVLWLGIGYNHSTIEVQSTSDNQAVNWDKYETEAKTDYEELGLLTNIEVEQIENGIKATAKPLMPLSLRSSISIGVKF